MVHEIEVKNGVMKVNCSGCIFGSSIEDFDVCMALTINNLLTEQKIDTITLSETRDHEYDKLQTELLKEIANAINIIIKEKQLLSPKNFSQECQRILPKRFPWLYNTIAFQLRGDPIGAYVNIIREIRRLNILLKKEQKEKTKICIQEFINLSEEIKKILENCQLIQNALPHLAGYIAGDRSLYRKVFHSITRPSFMFTKYSTKIPLGELVEKYKIENIEIEIFKLPGKVRPLYYIIPPEFKLSENEYTLLDDARKTLEARRPSELEMADQIRIREIFQSINAELINDLTKVRNFSLTNGQIKNLSEILTRHTVGLGIIELLLKDENIEDININSPLGELPIYIKHREFDECETNLIPTQLDAERWATRFKLLSGRPLDEANPVLDTELMLKDGQARIAAISPRLSPEGLAFAIRRHRFDPWTFPLYLQPKINFFNSMFAGLTWFLASYGRTLLVAGTRGSGKTSLLGSIMLQLIPQNRIITVEDTFELPIEALRKLNYNIERLKSRSVITRVELELPAEEVIRTALRLGDSCLFIGEVRSVEAKALYEAMRIGALANVVAGTIHGESAYGVFDRVVNDLGVPKTSFKATDIIIICNKIRTPDGLKSFRRVTEVTEVRKHWQEDPVEEHGFVNLMEYYSKTDSLRPTDTLLNGESFVLNEISRRVPGWYGQWDKVWENIELRGKILKTIADIAMQINPKLMEAVTLVQSNQIFHLLCEKSRLENGAINSNWVYNEWLNWFKNYAKTL